MQLVHPAPHPGPLEHQVAQVLVSCSRRLSSSSLVAVAPWATRKMAKNIRPKTAQAQPLPSHQQFISCR